MGILLSARNCSSKCCVSKWLPPPRSNKDNKQPLAQRCSFAFPSKPTKRRAVPQKRARQAPPTRFFMGHDLPGSISEVSAHEGGRLLIRSLYESSRPSSAPKARRPQSAPSLRVQAPWCQFLKHVGPRAREPGSDSFQLLK